MFNNIKWIFFDIGSTLIDESKAYEHRIKDTVNELIFHIFNLALERANCNPQISIMIGDWLDNDIVPAKSLGMHTIWIKQGFAKFTELRNELEKPDYVINDLNDIFKYL